jgi:hypothetical protein
MTLFVAVALAVPALADTITVPADYATIQAAIDAAADGDVIELDRDRFIGAGNRDLDFLNKELTIRPAPGRAGVRLDTQGTTHDQHRAGSLLNQTEPIVFIDLVFENGLVTADTIIPAGEGAALLIRDSAGVEFRGCVFGSNRAGGVGGGAIACYDSQVRFEDCHFHDNHIGGTNSYGADLYVAGGAVTIVDTTMESASHAAPGSFNSAVYGLSTAFVGGTHTVEGCLVQNNPRVNTSAYANGAGFYVDADVTVTDTVFRNNRAIYDDDLTGGTGGAAYVRGGTAQFTNCLFDGNQARGGYEPLEWPLQSAGAGIAVTGGGSATATNCTFVNNAATTDDLPPLGIVFAGPDGSAAVRNSIVYGNTGPALATFGNGAMDVEYSDVEGGAPGAGNIDADPVFEADFAPGAGSPVIDAGDNAAVPAGVTTDLAGNDRFIDDPATADTGSGAPPLVDMGAYEFVPSTECVADLTGDGTLDFFDVQEFLNRFSIGDPSVDFANDGVLDFFDVQAYLNLFAAGCP